MSRSFSKNEQDFLRKLVKYDKEQIGKKNFLYEISSFMSDIIICDEWINLKESIISASTPKYFKEISINVPKCSSIDYAFSVYYSFYENIFLLFWLEESNFISFSPHVDLGNGEIICKLPTPNENDYTPFIIPQDEQFVDNVCRVLFGKCFVNKTLYNFVSNKFRTSEEILSQKSLRLAWIGIITSAAISLFIGGCQLFYSKPDSNHYAFYQQETEKRLHEKPRDFSIMVSGKVLNSKIIIEENKKESPNY